jgi:hypothetical protein
MKDFILSSRHPVDARRPRQSVLGIPRLLASLAFAQSLFASPAVEVIAVHSQHSIKVPFAPLWALVLSAGAISMVAARRR